MGSQDFKGRGIADSQGAPAKPANLRQMTGPPGGGHLANVSGKETLPTVFFEVTDLNCRSIIPVKISDYLSESYNVLYFF